MEAMACRALSSSGGPRVQSEVEEAQHAPGRLGQEERHAGAADPLRHAREPFCTRSMYSSGWYVHAGKVGLAEVLGGGEDGVGVERHLAEGIRVGMSRGRPLGLEDAQTPLVVVAPEKGHVGPEELGQHPGRPGQHLLAGARRRRHEPFGHLTDQLVQTPLVQQRALPRGQRHGVAQEPAEGLGEGAFPARPRPPLTGDDEGADDVPVLQLDGLDQDTPRHARDHAGEGCDG